MASSFTHKGTGSNTPKALLFDIGGVCVLSPLKEILDYERAHGIPPGYINFAISRGAPNGTWHKLERGEISLNEEYFEAFAADLQDKEVWKVYWIKYHGLQNQRHSAGGAKDRVSAIPPVPRIDTRKMFWAMMRYSRTPDPHIFPALKKLKRLVDQEGKLILAALSNTIIFPEGIRDERGKLYNPGLALSDGTRLGFPDADMESAVARGNDIATSAPDVRPNMATASPANENAKDRDIRTLFSPFISSAHVGLRKPDAKIYELALEEINKQAKNLGWNQRVTSNDVLFLDDIGQNLRTARQLGIRTIKVNLGRTEEAVKELEDAIGVKLREEGKEEGKGETEKAKL